MDLKRYKYIRNIKPRYVGGKNLLATPTSILPNMDITGAITPKIDTSPLTYDKLKVNPNTSNPVTLSKLGAAGNNMLNNAGSIIQGGVQFAQSLGNAFSTASLPTESNLISSAGTTEGNVGGVSYEKVGAIDGDAAMKLVSSENTSNTLNAVGSGASVGSTVGSAFGPVGAGVGGVVGAIGGLIGGLFGGHRRKKKMLRRIWNAKLRAAYTNNYNMAGASTTSLQNKFYEENPTGNDILYADKGKDMKSKVWTPSGYQAGPTNSYVGKGESIVDYTNGTGTLVTKGKRGVDNQRSSVHQDDNNVIIGNDTDWTNGIKFSDQAAPFTAQLQTLNKFTKAGRYNNKSSLSGVTKDVQEREINKLRGPLLDNLKNISDRLAMLHQIANKWALDGFNYGKDKPKFDIGDDDDSIIRRGWDNLNIFSPATTPLWGSTNYQETPITIPYSPGYTENEPVITDEDAAIDTSGSERERPANGSGNSVDRDSSQIPWYQRMVPSLFGLTLAYRQYRTYNDQPIRYHNTYRSNPYLGIALRGLNNLRYDILPQLNAVRNAESRANYAINNAGGLSGAQKYLARIANAAATQRNLASAYATANDENNKYRSAYYDALNKAGESNRTAQIQAAQNDYNNYVKAHGAKMKGRDTAIANMINQVNSAYSNEFKYRTWQDSLDMYRQRLSQNDRDLINSMYNSRAQYGITPTTSSTSTRTSYTYPYSSTESTSINPSYPTWTPSNASWLQPWRYLQTQ